MNTPLQLRPVNIRLYVAYMADAYHGGYTKCSAGNTFTRFICEQTAPDNVSVLRNDHPYTKIWTRIKSFYNVKRLYELSDDEIMDMFNNARANGINGTAYSCTGMDIMRAKQRWDEYGWTRYERKRNGRRTVMWKYAPMAVVACFGISLPMD